MKRLIATIFIQAIMAIAAGRVDADIYTESGDAGQLPQTAQYAAISGPVDAIQGRIAHAYDVDIFCISIDDPPGFSARITSAGTTAPDLQLFLFDDWGMGIVADDNWLFSSLPQIPSGNLWGYAPGTYLLAVSPSDADPQGIFGEIFPDAENGLTQPAGFSRSDRLLSWSRDFMAAGGTYSIQLTGVSGIPEPSILLLLGMGAASLALYSACRKSFLSRRRLLYILDKWKNLPYVVFILLLCFTCVAQAEMQYNVIALSPIDYSSSTVQYAYGLNDDGVVVGTVSTYQPSYTYCASRWDNPSALPVALQNLGANSLGFTDGAGFGINSDGISVGQSRLYDSGTFQGFRPMRWDAAPAVSGTQLPMLNPEWTGYANGAAYAINAGGIIVGYSQKIDSPGGTRAVRWDAVGAITELAALSPDVASHAEAHAINDEGTTVGWAEYYVGTANLDERAIRWAAGGTVIERLYGLSESDLYNKRRSKAFGINNNGTVVGVSAKYDDLSNKGHRAVYWDADGNAAHELGLGTIFFNSTYGSAMAEASDINDEGWIVGTADRYVPTYQQYRAVLWDPAGNPFDLNDLIDPNSGWTLRHAYAINEQGWITGLGIYDPDGPGEIPANDYAAFVLKPVPEPSAIILISMAIFGWALYGWRRR